MNKTKVLITLPELENRKDDLDRIATLSPRIEMRACPSRSVEETAEILEDEEILYTLWIPARLKPESRLKWVQMSSTGIDNKLENPIFDPDRNITVTNAAGCHAASIGEYCLAAMGALVRGFPRFFRDKALKVRDRSHSTLENLYGKTVGIAGYGHIGREVARLAAAHRMRVLALDKFPDRRRMDGFVFQGDGDPDGSIPEKIYDPDGLNQLLEESDVIVCCLPLTGETANIFGSEAFDLMKKSAYFINISRGGTVDHDALAAALKNGGIAGAALDALYSDPQPMPEDHPLWELENVIITPHIAGNRNRGYIEKTNRLFQENLKRYLTDGPLLNIVSKERGY